MWRISLKNAWGHKRRLSGTAVAIFLGVAFLSGTIVLGDTLSANFDDLFADATVGDAIVRDPDVLGDDDFEQATFLDDSLVDQVASVDGVAAAAPYVEGFTAVLDEDGNQVGGSGPPRLGGNWVDNPELNPNELVEGRGPRTDDEVVISTNAAEDAGLEVGDRATVQVPGLVDVEVVGLASFAGRSDSVELTFTGFTLEAAQQHLAGRQDGINRVLVEAEDGVSQDELVRRLEPVVPDGVEVITGDAFTDEERGEIDEFLVPLRTSLVAFAAIALFVATFNIHNTFAIVVSQRSREIGLLRAVGGGRRQIMRSIAVEAAAVGLVASAAGVAGGLGVAGLLKGLFDTAGFALPAGGLVLTPTGIVVPLVVGVVATLAAALLPARRASRIPPMAALRDAAVEQDRSPRLRVAVGGGLLALGVSLVLVTAASTSDDLVLVAGIGALACLSGVVAMGPAVARPAGAVLGWPLARLRGVGGALARRNAVRSPRRTAATASALLIGVSVVVLLTVFATSVSTALGDSVSRAVGGDLVAASPPFTRGGLDPEIGPAVDELDEVEAAAGVGIGMARVDGDEQALSYAAPAALDRVLDLDVSDGSLADLGDDEVAVSRSTADDNGWDLGSAVPVEFVDGAAGTFSVGAIFDGSGPVSGLFMTREAAGPHLAQEFDTAVFVALADGVDLEEGRRAVQPVVSALGGPDVEDRDGYADTMTEGLDLMLGVLYALLALAVVIALLGIANTLSLSTHERRRELGILRAVGQTRSQMRRMVRDESVMISVLGTLGGLGLGLFLGWALVQAVAADVATFTVPVTQLAVIVVAGAAAGVLAGLRPARRAARLDVLASIGSK